MSTSIEDIGHDRGYYILGDDNSYSQTHLSSFELTTYQEAIHKTADRLISEASEAIAKNADNYKLLANVAYDYTKKHFAIIDPKSSKVDQSLALLFRNKISAEALSEMKASNHDWYRMVMANKLHYKILASESPLLDNEPSLSIDGNATAFNSLEKREVGQEIHWFKNDKLQFVTDKDLQLKDHYFVGVSGILPGSASKPKEGNEFKPLLKVPPTGEYKIWVMSSLKDKEDICIYGDHVYLGVQNKEGEVAFFGQYSKHRQAPWYTFLQKYEVLIESPDRYTGLPQTSHYHTKKEITISEAQYQKLTKTLSHEIYEKNTDRRGSALIDNCTGFVASTLSQIGVDIKAKRSVGSLIFDKILSFLPKPISKPLSIAVNALPSPLKKLMYYPVMGIPVFLMGLAIKTAGMFASEGNHVDDFTLWQLITKPWTLQCNHPHAVYEWIIKEDEVKPKEEGIGEMQASISLQSNRLFA